MKKKKQSKYENAYPVGHKFGMWTLVDSSTHRLPYGGGKYGEPAYKVRCDCGVEKLVSCTRLVMGISASCRCWMYRSGKDNPNWKGEGEIPGRYLNRIENSASKRGIEYNLNATLLSSQLSVQSSSCNLTGTPLVFGMASTELNTNASLDRINSSVGYVSGNVQWVTKDVNLAKQSMPQPDFIEMCIKVVEHQGHKVIRKETAPHPNPVIAAVLRTTEECKNQIKGK